jgi:GAF domain-containing protein
VNNNFQIGLTYTFNLIFLLMSLWLGLYIVLRDPRRRVSWLSAAALWFLSGHFLTTLTSLHALPGETLPWWWGWSSVLALPPWYHLSVVLLPGERPGEQRGLLILAYLLVLNLIAMEANTPLIFRGVGEALPHYYSYLQPGRLFPLYGLYLVVIPALSLWNFHRGWAVAKNFLLRHLYTLFQIASLMAALAGVYASISIWLEFRTPMLITTIALGSGAALLGYGVARWSAFVQGRVHRRDFLISAAATALVVSGYLLVAELSNLAFQVPPIAYILLVCFAIITHALYEFGLGVLDRYFSSRMRHRDMLANLRDLARGSHPEADLQERLQTLLQALCDALEVRRGFLVRRGGEEAAIRVPPGETGDLLCDALADPGNLEMQIVRDPEDPQRGAAIVAPLLHGGAQHGVILLGPDPVVHMLTDDDLDLVEAFVDRVADVIHTAELQKRTAAQLEAIARQFKDQNAALQAQTRDALKRGARVPEAGDQDEAAFREMVEDALRHMGDYSYLGRHELAALQVVSTHAECLDKDQLTHLDLGRALHELLSTCVEKLNPSGPRPAPPTREWHPYVILRDSYIEGERTRDVMSTLYISEASYHRARRRAVKAVARALQELEQGATPHSSSA